MKKNSNRQLLERFFERSASEKEILELYIRLNDKDFEEAWMYKEWQNADANMDPVVVKKMYDNVKRKISHRRFNYKSWLNIAALIIVLIVSSIFVNKITNNGYFKDDMTICVAKGQKADVTMPDGSHVWINSGSTIKWGNRFNHEERIVYLTGEAYFDVAKNDDAPFIVQSKDFSVRALGTSFNVKAYPEDDQFSVVLIEGVVEAGNESSRLKLLPNQKIVYHRLSGDVRKTAVADGTLYAGWVKNKLSFDSETFESIASTLERSFNVNIILESSSLKDIRYSGTLENSGLENILHSFSLTSPLLYRIEDKVIYLSEDTRQIPVYKKITHKKTFTD